MLAEALTALAAAGGTAVVEAAGSDSWTLLRRRVAQLLGQGDSEREHAALERLDHTSQELETAEPDRTSTVQISQAASWRTRFEMLLESATDAEQRVIAAELHGLLADLGLAPGTPPAAGGVTAGRDVNINAAGGVAAAVINGGVQLGTPSRSDS
ncbi:hypothetical protein ACFXAW_31330 [Streptomyces sp. NPDC059445]|uniref:hypothetical protein n=1 Tax=Streptomyces sp. NPDC059445 TaxID=3346832 RepID=UPI00369939F9